MRLLMRPATHLFLLTLLLHLLCVKALPCDGGLSQCQTSGLAMAAAAVKDTE
jgi:hypothetical protein